MNYQNTILEKIVEAKKEEIASSKSRESLADLRGKSRDAEATRDFLKVFEKQGSAPSPRPSPSRGEGGKDGELPETRIIAEIKKASPSAGLLQPHFDPVKIAHQYLDLGAAAISVLTDPSFFQGSLSDLQAVRKISHRPLLRKDFMIHPYQFYQARAYGADCVLAIVAILEKQQLIDFCGLAEELGMCSLIEVHNAEELAVALSVKQEKMLIGVNNRNLKNLKIDLKTTENLRPLIPSHLKLISESGISKREEIEHLLKLPVDGFLIGETFLKSKSIEGKFRELIGDHQSERRNSR